MTRIDVMNDSAETIGQRATRVLTGQKKILEDIVLGRDLIGILDAICRLIEAEEPGSILCSVMVLDPDRAELRLVSAPAMPADLVAAIKGMPIGPTTWSFGAAYHRGATVIVEDIATDPLCRDYRSTAQRHHLLSSWSSPFFSESTAILGVFSIYYLDCGPLPEHAALIEAATQTAAIAVQHHRTLEQLHESENRFRLVSHATNDVVWDWDLNEDDLWWNENLISLFGYSPADMARTSASWFAHIHPDDIERISSGMHAAIDGAGSLWSADYRFCRADGSYAHVYDRGYLTRDAAGKAMRMIGAMQDISDRKEAENRLRRMNRVYAVLSGINTLIVRVRSRSELLQEACKIAATVGGFGMVWIGLCAEGTRNVIPAAWAGVDADDDKMTLIESFAQTDAEDPELSGRAIREGSTEVIRHTTGDRTISYDNRHDAFKASFRSVIVLPLVVEDKTIGTFSFYTPEADFFDTEEVRLLRDLAGNISFALQYLAKEEKAHYLAYYDPVTNLPNRSLFIESLRHAIHTLKPGSKVALVIGDIQRFRSINETLGHAAGDELLKKVADRLLRTVQNPENLSRISGNHFATFVPGIDDPIEVARRVINVAVSALHAPINIADQELSVGFSTGIALYPDHGSDADTLFRNAEAALRSAKSRREYLAVYSPEMNAQAAEVVSMGSRLRHALELEQFVLHYQPKIHIDTGVPTGFEALIRWQDPERGLVPPMDFIPLLEETGLILEVGQWALERAVADHNAWRSAGLNPPRVAVNVSSIQLRQPNFVKIVERVIADFDGNDTALDLEITESEIMLNMGEMSRKLRDIRNMGVQISMDDFGTGYSSLSYLARLSIDSLKIDRSFIADIASDGHSRNIVTMIIQLAHALSLSVIGEGIEHKEQLHILKKLQCDSVQGYLLSRPLPPKETEAFLDRCRGAGAISS